MQQIVIRTFYVLVLIFTVLVSKSYAYGEGGKTYDTGVTSLMNAVAVSDHRAVEFFIKISPLNVNQQNIGGATALHIAVRNNDFDSTKLLIKSNANPNLKDIEGYSSAMRACLYNYNNILNSLNSKSVVDYTVTNNKRDGFIIVSALAKNSECLARSLRNIIPLRDISIVELKDRLNKAFIISLAKDDGQSKEILLKYLKKLQMFQDKVAQLSQYDHKIKKRVIKKSVALQIINTIYVLKEGYKGIVIEKVERKVKKNNKSNNKINKIKKEKKLSKKYRLKKNKASVKSLKKFKTSSIERSKQYDQGIDLLFNETTIIE